MIVKEKKIGEKSWSELLCHINDIEPASKKEETLMTALPLQNDWHDFAESKTIILFHPDLYIEKNYTSIDSRIGQYFSALYSLAISLGNIKDIVLWWYDEGVLKSWIDKVDDKDRHNKLITGYLWITQCCFSRVIHDESGNLARAIQWTDLYYGDKSLIYKEWIRTGKPLISYTSPDVSAELNDWLDIAIIMEINPCVASSLREITGQRKCILFNMNISDLLLNGDKAISLVEQLSCLAKSRDDLFFWWIFDSELLKNGELMLDRLQEDFKKAIQNFRGHNNTFIDVSNDVYSLLEQADVFYGSPHAIKACEVEIPQLYPKYDRIKKLPLCPQMSSIYRENGKIYFLYNERNVFAVLCEADLATDDVNVLCDVPVDVEDNEWGLDYFHLIKAHDKIIVAPCFSEKGFFEYDLTTGISRLISCKQTIWKPNRMHYSAFDSYTVWRNSAYFLGNANGLIVEYNFESNEYIYHNQWSKEISKQVPLKEMIFTNSERIEDFLYAVVKNTNLLVRIDLSAMCASILSLQLPEGFQVHRLMHVLGSSDLWMSPTDGNVVICLHTVSNELVTVKCDLMPDIQRYPFFSVVQWKAGVAFLPYYAKNVYFYSAGERAYSDFALTAKFVRPFENFDKRNEICAIEKNGSKDSVLLFRERGTELVELRRKVGEVVYHKFRFKPIDRRMLNEKIKGWNMNIVIKPIIDVMVNDNKSIYYNCGEEILETIKK